MNHRESETYRGLGVEAFLRDHVHKKAYREYVKRTKNGDVAQAEKMQMFLRQLKNAALQDKTEKTGRSSVDKIINDTMLAELMDELDKQLYSAGFSKGAKWLFQRTGKNSYKRGEYFERDLEALMKAIIAKSVDSKKLIGKDIQIRTGQVVGTTTITKQMIENITNLINQGVSEEEAFKRSGVKDYDLYQRQVQIKTDINGLPDIFLDADIKDEWKDIFNLFKGATISAKSYALHTYNREEDGWKLKEMFPNLKLGETADPYRAIAGTVQDLGYSRNTAEWTFFAGNEEVLKNNQEVINHMYHLKYIYELTGAGVWNAAGIGRAKFLIFNDPTSDLIYVQSAASLIDNLFDENFSWHGSPFGAIRISTKKFYEQAFDKN